MNRSQLKKEIIADEGMVKHIYEDHLGYPTFGVGHLITEKDPEWKKSLGTQVSEERVHECLEKDLDIVLKDCKILYPDFDDLPEEVQHIVANMMFNLGRPRLSAFKGMKKGVDSKDWNKAADEMVDSRWYKQVTNRANRLVERMRKVNGWFVKL